MDYTILVLRFFDFVVTVMLCVAFMRQKKELKELRTLKKD